jgi:hypothetical protein
MKSRFLALGSSPVIFLTHVSRALADGHGHGHDHGVQDESETIQGIKDELDNGPRTYFALSDNSGLIYSHIALMTIAWIVILPVGTYTLSMQEISLTENPQILSCVSLSGFLTVYAGSSACLHGV